ncbi:MAG: threonine/serine exporter family protein [Deltaproteobacteria bacterium]|nr:threonine/serine exporter family protein [Deltaproteobacteria bacterium]
MHRISGVPAASLDESADLLLDFAQAMHRVQMPADAIEGHLRAIAARLGVSADTLLLQSAIAVEVRDGSGERVALRRIGFEAHWRLARVRELIDLADACAAGAYSPVRARARLRAILAERWHVPRFAVVTAYGVYGAAVAARVGGRDGEMLVAALAGLLTGFVHYVAIGRRALDLQKVFAATLAATLLVLGCATVFEVDGGRALFGGITLLVPASAITIGTHELANDALESGTSRLAYALVRFLMTAAGLAAAIKLWMLLAPLPPPTHVAPLPAPEVLAILVAGGLALVLCLQARPSDAPWIVFGVLVAYGAQALTKRVFGPDGAPLIAAFVLGAAGYAHARVVRDGLPATVIVPGLLQISTGFLGTQAVFGLLRGEAGGHATFFQVFLVAFQLVGGLLLASVLFADRRRSGAE